VAWLSGRHGRRHQRSPPIACGGRLCQGPHRGQISDPGEPPKGGFAVDRSSSSSLQYRHSPRAVLLMSAVTNREATHEAHSNIPMLGSSPDILPPDPYPFLGEAPAPDPRLISSPREEPVPLPSMLRAAGFWSKPPKTTHRHPRRSPSIAPPNRDARQLLYRPPCAVPAALRQARGNNSGGRC
jgi:hypothetical protein